MLPPEFYEQLQRIRDHQLQNPPEPKTVQDRIVTAAIIALFVLLVLVFALGFYLQEISPWINYVKSIFTGP